jgi:hypothetical protein
MIINKLLKSKAAYSTTLFPVLCSSLIPEGKEALVVADGCGAV